MKPTFSIFISPVRRDSCEHAMRRRTGWPATDYNYHPLTFEESSRRYVRNCARSFWNITGEYFKNEARYEFWGEDRKSTRLNSSHQIISYAVFCLKKKKTNNYSYKRIDRCIKSLHIK